MFLPFKNRFSLQFGRRRVAFLICFIMSFDSAIFPAPFWAMSPDPCRITSALQNSFVWGRV